MGYEVKPASFTDIGQIVHLAGLFHDESGGALPFDPVHFSSAVAGWLTGKDSAAIGLYDGGALMGVLLASITDYSAAPIKQANELLWYIHPKARGKSALKMIDAYKSWAKDMGAGLVFIGAYQNNAAPIYQRKGFEMIETYWVCK